MMSLATKMPPQISLFFPPILKMGSPCLPQPGNIPLFKTSLMSVGEQITNVSISYE
jgi:hypothetical protein